MKRPRTEFPVASLAALPVAVTLEVHSLRGDALEDGPEQGSRGAPTISAGATITPSDCPQPASPGNPYAPTPLVEFEPSGTVPRSDSPGVLTFVGVAKSADPSDTLPDLAGRNVVFLLGDSVVDKGGRYTGTAVTRAQDDRVLLVLKDVRPLP